MKLREEIPATLPTPPRFERRISTSDKVRQIVSVPTEPSAPLQPVPSSPSASRPATAQPRRPKLTTRVLPEQLAWIHDEIARYRREFPRAPRLTVAELVQIALEELRESKNLDYVIAKFRS